MLDCLQIIIKQAINSAFRYFGLILPHELKMTLQRVSQLLVRGALALGAGLLAAAAPAQTGPIKIGGNASIGKVAQATAKI